MTLIEQHLIDENESFRTQLYEAEKKHDTLEDTVSNLRAEIETLNVQIRVKKTTQIHEHIHIHA